MSTEHQETVPGPGIVSRRRRRRFRGKRFAVAAVLTAAMAAVAACGGGSGDGGGGGGGGDATTINYWSPPQGGRSESGTKEALQPLVDKFKAESGITVNVEVVDWSSLLAKLTSAIASNTGPDVAGGGNTWNGIYTDTGGIVSWTPEMLDQIGGKDQFLPAFVQTMGYPDKDPISIPIGAALGRWSTTRRSSPMRASPRSPRLGMSSSSLRKRPLTRPRESGAPP
jgi:ABC-type glycerol-3-phosphate transport system substrate-binding protein